MTRHTSLGKLFTGIKQAIAGNGSSSSPRRRSRPVRRPASLELECLETRVLMAASASFQWNMAATLHGKNGDPNGNTLELADQVATPVAGYEVDLDGSSSSGPVANYSWTIRGGGIPIPPPLSVAKSTAWLQPGLYSVSLTVTDTAGVKSTTTQDVNVHNLLIVTMGDSMASGEGSPEVRQVFDFNPQATSGVAVTSDAQWADVPPVPVPTPGAWEPSLNSADGLRSHRSTRAAGPQAAWAIEQADPHTSVTLFDFAASGAGIDNLIDHGYAGQKPIAGMLDMPPQIAQVKAAVGGRQIDDLFLSIGANDVGFSGIATDLLLHGRTRQQIQEDFDQALVRLQAKYDDLDRALRSNLNVANVYITEYIDPTTGDDGKPSSGLLGDFVPGLLAVSQADAAWAQSYVVTRLNQAVSAAAEKFGWHLVGGIASGFQKHGYTVSTPGSGFLTPGPQTDNHPNLKADKLGGRWIRTASESRLIQGPAYHNSAPGDVPIVGYYYVAGVVDSALASSGGKEFLYGLLASLGAPVGIPLLSSATVIKAFTGKGVSGSDIIEAIDMYQTDGTLHPNEFGQRFIESQLLATVDLTQSLTYVPGGSGVADLTVTGTDRDDTITLTENIVGVPGFSVDQSTNPPTGVLTYYPLEVVDVTVNGRTQEYPRGLIHSIRIDAGKGTNTLIIADGGHGNDIVRTGPDLANTFVVSPSSVSVDGVPMSYAGMQTLAITMGPGQNKAIINGTAAGVTTTINGGTDRDTISVAAGGQLSAIQGPLTLNGGGGADTLVIHDEGTVAGQTYTLTDGYLDRSGAVRIGYSAIANLTLNTSNGADTINVTPSPTTAMSVNANGPVPPTIPGDALTLNLAGVTNTSLAMTGTGAGQWTFGNRQAVSFTGVESVPAPQLLDPGFETLVMGGGAGAYRYNPSGSAWTFNSGSGVTANATNFTGLNPNAPQGSQVAFLQGTGAISQSIGFALGTYTLSFQAAQRYGNQQTFQVQVDGLVVGTFTPASTSYATFTTSSFVVRDGAHMIKFVGLNPRGGDNTVFIDQVTVQMADLGFETPALGSGAGAYRYNPSGSAWTFNSGSGVTANATNFTGFNPNAPQGSQVAFLQGTGATVSQSIVFLGGTYVVSFQAAQRFGNQQTIQVLVDGNAVGTFTPAGSSYAAYTTLAFNATAGAHTIKFVGLNPRGGDNTVFIDQVTIQRADLGFETPALGSGPGAYQYNPAGSAWTFLNGLAGVAGNGSAFTGSNPNAPEGSQVAFLQGTGAMSQAVVFASSGTYNVSFRAAQRANIQSNAQTFQVLLDGAVLGTFTPTSTNYLSFTTLAVNVTAGAHTIKFVGLNPRGGDNTVFIDTVSIQSPIVSELVG